jgi:hypothetical protein
VPGKVGRDLAALKMGSGSVQKMRHSGSEFNWDVLIVGFPVGAKEELGRDPFFVAMSKEHLGIDVSLESFGADGEFFWPGCIFRLNAEINLRPKRER